MVKKKNILDELIKRHELVEKVKFMGFSEDLEEIFGQIDIYVQPSLSEAFGLTVVEAMMAEKPVVVTPKGSLPELIKDGKTGLIANGSTPEALAASIRLLVDDVVLAENVAKAGKEEALERFNVDKFVDETLKVFRETIGNK